jgi:nitroreductase
MEILRGIRMRRSIRAFKKRPIEKSILEKIILTASNSPSYSNTQPWKITIVTGEKREELVQNLYETAQSRKRRQPAIPFPRTWPQEMRKRSSVHTKSRFKAAKIPPNDPEGKRKHYLNNFAFFDAPVVIIVYLDERLGPWSVFDLGLFVQNLLLSAYGKGLGTCIQAMPVAYPDVIRKALGIPSSMKIVVTVAIGYEDETAPINGYLSEKKNIEEWVEWLGF